MFSFSGGKDSTVLLHIAREMYGDAMKAVYVDTGLEYPEIRSFVKTFDNVDWVRPKKHFKQVCEEYGFPLVGKEVAERVYYAKKYLTWYTEQNSLGQTDRQPTDYSLRRFLNLPKKPMMENIPDKILENFVRSGGKGTYKIAQLIGEWKDKEGNPSIFNFSNWKWLATAPFYCSQKCCDVMKKEPVHRYRTETGRKDITGEMASESQLRTRNWLMYGCNAFDAKTPKSRPLSFWNEQDILLYIKTFNIPIASVYGDIVVDYQAMGQCD